MGRSSPLRIANAHLRSVKVWAQRASPRNEGGGRPVSSQTQGRTVGRGLISRLFAVINALIVVAAVAIPTVVFVTPAGASVSSASFNVAFAHNGTPLVLTVNTS